VLLLLVISFTALAAIVTGVGPAEGIGDDGPVLPLVDTGRGEASTTLAMELNRTTVTVGDRVGVAVTLADEPARNAVVTAGNTSERVGPDGRVAFTPTRPGRLQVTANVTDEGYTNTSTRVTVERRVIGLSVSTNVTDPVTAQPVGVAVTYANGSPARATVLVDGRPVPTGSDGRATVRVSWAGAVTLTAEKPVTRTRRFVVEETTVSVSRRTVTPKVTLPTRPLATEPVTVRVSAPSGPLNAVVRTDSRIYRTDPNGTVTVDYSAAGEYDLSVRVPRTDAVRYRPIDRRVMVHRERVALRLDPVTRRVPLGESTTVTLRRADTNATVVGSVVVGGTTLSTDRTGTVRLDPLTGNPGTYRSIGRAPQTPTTRFVPAVGSVIVVGPDLVVEAVAFDTISAGEETTVGARVRNAGTARANGTISVRVNGRVLAAETVDLDPTETTRVRLSVDAPTVPGVYEALVAADEDIDDTGCPSQRSEVISGSLRVRPSSGTNTTTAVDRRAFDPACFLRSNDTRGGGATRD
jgi:hypothetical protein